MAASQIAVIVLLGLLVATNIDIAGAQLGVCYGMMGNNLPSHWEVIQLYKSRNLGRLRLYDPNHGALQALRGSNIEVMLGLPNSDVKHIASGMEHANWWVQKNVRDFWPDVKIKYIAVGNEISPVTGTSYLTSFLIPAMVNIHKAIGAAGLGNDIKVSTSVDMTLIGNSYPPSQGSFRNDARWFTDPIVGFLRDTRAPLLVNIYPYFSYSGNPGQISLPYALFTAPNVVVYDGSRQYRNLFDAMLDSVYAALDRSGGGSVGIVVSESGWPSAGAFGATTDNAATYLRGLIQHVREGSPRKPGPIETYIFAMFDENNKNPELEKHFGLFSPNKQPKYNLNFGVSDRVWEISAETNATVSLWSDSCEKSFQELKTQLTTTPILTLPDGSDGFLMAPFEVLYRRRGRYPISWFEMGKATVVGPDLVSYELKLPSDLASVHPVFHVSMLKKCIGDPVVVVFIQGVDVQNSLSYEEVTVKILDYQIHRLKNKEVPLVKVLWQN
ncbi:Glucan endo-1,3-beta-glucosidase, basic vacuolar isoform [Capsicum chinense]|nr:Glucan endo-1,3-beta-glucosidase, basic vacuolar isoform [Capsicum chinense]